MIREAENSSRCEIVQYFGLGEKTFNSTGLDCIKKFQILIQTHTLKTTLFRTKILRFALLWMLDFSYWQISLPAFTPR